MAEAIATLGLVCNVMQVISFTGEVMRLYRTISKEGSPAPEIVAELQFLEQLSTSLQLDAEKYDPVQRHTSGKPDQTESFQQTAQQRLKSLAADLAKDCKALDVLLRRFAISASSAMSHQWMTAIKYRRKYKKRTEELEKRIAERQKALNTEFLNRIW
ncbi:hypothetical protein F5Y15DRAFT_269580 [Xylariaceae sp. FL0016]|nr:hypothetical protein F5Y15DRAFT_269580 [Xylariaceae sp. FL0016]